MRRHPLTTRLARGAERLDTHRTALGLAVIAVSVVAFVLSVMAINGLPLSHPYELRAVVPSEAPVVRPGDEVRVAGERVGEVRDVKPYQAGEGRLVEMDIDDGKASEDASARVRLRGLAGAVFIELDRGVGEPAPDGFTIPRERTGTGTQLTDVVSAFDQETNEALSASLQGYGSGLAGRGGDLNAAFADLPPLLKDSRPLLEAANPSPGQLGSLIGDAGKTAHGFAGEKPDDVSGLITGASETLDPIADQRDALGESLRRAPGALDEARSTLPVAAPLLTDLERASRALSPGVAELSHVMPTVNRLLTRKPELGRLGMLARAAQPVLQVAGPVLSDLAPAAGTLEPLIDAATPLAAYVSQYPAEVLAGPTGFTTWGDFAYDEGQAPGARAVRFTPVLTPAAERNPYPEPGTVDEDRAP